MKIGANRTTLAAFLIVAIACAAIFIIWSIAVGDGPPSNSVLIESAGKGRAGQPNLNSIGTRPTATQRALGSGGAKGITLPGLEADGALAQVTPNSILGAATPTVATITVYISGAVAKPGVYTLREGSRVQDAIAAAGGAMIEADLDSLNLAVRLTDEAHIVVGRRDGSSASSIQQPAASIGSVPGAPVDGEAISQAAGAKPTPSAPININSATEAELQTLPGVGPSLAARIVTDRDKNGPFATIEDLTRVTGIKEGILSKIRAYITVGQ